MAWLSCDKDGMECVFNIKPMRLNDCWDCEFNGTKVECDFVELPADSINKLIGRNLTWEDEPVEI